MELPPPNRVLSEASKTDTEEINRNYHTTNNDQELSHAPSTNNLPPEAPWEGQAHWFHLLGRQAVCYFYVSHRREPRDVSGPVRADVPSMQPHSGEQFPPQRRETSVQKCHSASRFPHRRKDVKCRDCGQAVHNIQHLPGICCATCCSEEKEEMHRCHRTLPIASYYATSYYIL